MKTFINLCIIEIILLSLTGCDPHDPYMRYADNSFSFKQSETVISVTEDLKTLDIYGMVARETVYSVSIYILDNETTAVEGTHYRFQNQYTDNTMDFYDGSKEQKVSIEIIPENITEELKITLTAGLIYDELPITPGGYEKTVIKLVPAGAEQ